MADSKIEVKGYVTGTSIGTRAIDLVYNVVNKICRLLSFLPIIGDVSITLDAGTTWVTLIAHPSSVSRKTLKGAGGDTGIRLAKTGPMLVAQVPTAGQTIIINLDTVETFPVYGIGS